MRPDATLLDPSRYPSSALLTTRYTDIDPNRHVNNVAIMALLEDGHARLFERLDRTSLSAARVVVAHRATSFLAEIGYPDPVTVHAGVAAIGRSSWRVATLAVQNGVVAVYGEVTLVTKSESGVMPEPWRVELEAYCLF